MRRIGEFVDKNTLLTNSLNAGLAVSCPSKRKPTNKIPKPATISPKMWIFLFFDRRGIAPIKAKNANTSVKCSIPESDAMNVVTVVPIFAPMIQAHAWKSVIAPISANLTSVTEVTSED